MVGYLRGVPTRRLFLFSVLRDSRDDRWWALANFTKKRLIMYIGGGVVTIVIVACGDAATGCRGKRS